jgi:hypothetical protein
MALPRCGLDGRRGRQAGPRRITDPITIKGSPTMTKRTSRSKLDRTARVHSVGNARDELRQVDSLVSIVRVTAGPLKQVNRYMKARDSGVGFTTYVCEGLPSYIGHGYAERRLGERLSVEDRSRIKKAYVIHSSDPKFSKEVTQSIEDRLIEIARANGVPLANDPAVGGLGGSAARSPETEELLRDILHKIEVAGCNLFEQRHAASRHSNIICDGVKVVRPRELARLKKTQPRQLTYCGLRAQACRAGKKLIVLPGSDFSLIEKTGLTKYNRGRRTSIRDAGVVAELPGVTNHARLRVGLAFESPAVAAKLIAGRHVGAKVWKSAKKSARQENAQRQKKTSSRRDAAAPLRLVAGGRP